MEQELQESFEQFRRRLAVLQELQVALEQAQAGLLASDIERLEIQTARQLELCRSLQVLMVPGRWGTTGCGWVPLPEGVVDPGIQQRWGALGRNLAAVERRIGHLNRVHAALLRKAHRSVEIFARLLTSSAITYAPPERNGAAATAPSGRE